MCAHLPSLTAASLVQSLEWPYKAGLPPQTWVQIHHKLGISQLANPVQTREFSNALHLSFTDIKCVRLGKIVNLTKFRYVFTENKVWYLIAQYSLNELTAVVLLKQIVKCYTGRLLCMRYTRNRLFKLKYKHISVRLEGTHWN